ncbi:alpha/beta fold hydrolase [Roseisolibacter sp. H3M3-2]|uniref:alpha/beta fold hydrolase n=1 Tax=Roseisolibacter sp. H3M3-2 TaxID=3031323 RepID=UPI0023D9957D|nr:alpha/beta fold hydrolase [Roseisolibacter sp. H3M3-2]MDF1502946.1 alpha/beta fold hydrolase [Roseisolibacter sp. H3M3-2]
MQRIAALTLAAGACLACGGDPVGQGEAPRLTLSPDSLVVGVAESSPLVATVTNAGGAVQYVPLQYVSRDPKVATVSANGAISAVAVGATYVVATLAERPEVRDSVRVRVHADSCSGARPHFGGPATAEDRKLFAYDADAPLRLQQTVESTSGGVETSRVSFDSPDGGSVTGMVWAPVARPGPRPAIVLLHGLPGTARLLSERGQGLAQAGAVVLAIDAPFSRRAGPALTFTPQDRFEQIQVVKDLQRAVDVLRARTDVDPARVAFVGFSWGGATGALFVGIERRLRTAALVVGHGGQVSHATGPDGFKHIAGLSCAQRVAWIRAMAPVEPIRYVGNANAPLLLQNGMQDEFIPRPDAAELHAAAPDPKDVRWYATGHVLGQQALADFHRWMHEKIGLDLPAGPP